MKFISPYIPAEDAQYIAAHNPTVQSQQKRSVWSLPGNLLIIEKAKPNNIHKPSYSREGNQWKNNL